MAVGATGASARPRGGGSSPRCPTGSTAAVISGKHLCLKSGLRCVSSYEVRYRNYGFSCAAGKLVRPWVIHDLAAVAGGDTASVQINEQGQVIVSYLRPTRQPPAVWENGTLIPLGTTFGRAMAINDSGEIVGWHDEGQGTTRAFVWRNGQLVDLPSLGGPNSYADAINNRGQIVGYSQTRSGESHAVLWDNDTVQELGTLGGPNSYASAINNRGQIVGSSDTATASRPFLWDNGTMTDLGVDGASATAINDNGEIIGAVFDVFTSALLWEGGELRLIDGPGGTPADSTNYVYIEHYFAAINAQGQIAGWIGAEMQYEGMGTQPTTYETVATAALWQHGQKQTIAPLGGGSDKQGYAYAINDRSQIVGESTYDEYPKLFHAFIWKSGTITDLGTLGGRQSSAQTINEHAQIAGTSTAKDGRPHLVLWTPRAGS